MSQAVLAGWGQRSRSRTPRRGVVVLQSATVLLLLLASNARSQDLPALPTFDEEMDRALQNPPLKMRFQGNSTDELKSWQRDFAAQLRELIGPHRPPLDWKEQQLSRRVLNDHIREEWLLSADGVPSLPLYVLIPKDAPAEPLPIVIALHGHGPDGHDSVVGIAQTEAAREVIEKCNYDYGLDLVREGYLVVAPCMTPFGRRLSEAGRNGRTDPCAVAFVRMMYLGQTLIGANLRDVLWSLEYASRRPDGDAQRIGCVGLSYGGRMTMLATALEPRIRVAVISGAMNVFQERAQKVGYSCGAQVIPGLLNYGDTPEIGSLIAPRPCLWEMGNHDGLIVPEWDELAIKRLQDAFQAAGALNQLQLDRFEGAHEWHGEKALPLLARELKPSP